MIDDSLFLTNDTNTVAIEMNEYLEWLDTQMRFFYRNPQVCRTYYVCLVRLQSMLRLPISNFKLPVDRS